MRKRHVMNSLSLRIGQVTTDELLSVIQMIIEPADTIIYFAKWGSDDSDSGTEKDSLSSIEDPEDLRYLRLDAHFKGGESIKLWFAPTGTEVSWVGAYAAELARRVQAKWDRFPGRAPLGYDATYRLFFAHGVLLLLLTLAGLTVSLAGGSVSTVLAVLLVAVGPLIAMALWSLKSGPYLARRTVESPLISSRPDSWISDPRFLIPTILATIATIAGVASAVVDLGGVITAP